MFAAEAGDRLLFVIKQTLLNATANVRVGSKPEVSGGHENVGFRGQSGSRFRATGCLFIAISRNAAPSIAQMDFLDVDRYTLLHGGKNPT